MKKFGKFIQNDNNNAIAYYRYSDVEQSETSIDQQREAAHEYAEKHGFEIIKEYSDIASGEFDSRKPDLVSLLREVNKLKPTALILWKLDRLSKDVGDCMITMANIYDAGCEIYYVASDANSDPIMDLLIEMSQDPNDDESQHERISTMIEVYTKLKENAEDEADPIKTIVANFGNAIIKTEMSKSIKRGKALAKKNNSKKDL